MGRWAVDLGTTNCGVARWDEAADRPRLVELPRICRQPGGTDHLEAPRLVPSAVHLTEPEGFWGKLGAWRPFRRRLWGCHGFIGRQALERNDSRHHANFAPTFKAALSRSALKPLARLGARVYTARDIGRVFVRELLREVKSQTGERIEDLVVTTPVDSYEGYRAELQRIGRAVGIKRMRFVDEPVAAAVGYGLGWKHRRHVLVVDFGAGTLDLALVELTAKGLEQGRCQVVAKAGRALGGDLVDRWLVREFCERLDYPLREDGDEQTRFWFRQMLAEARRVKESVFFNQQDAFYLTPPEEMRAFEARIRGDARLLEVSQADVTEILRECGLYRALGELTDRVVQQAAAHGVPADAIDEVLMVGGSTLLPQVYGHFEQRFGRDRVRAWQPFEAVAYGACAFAAGGVTQSDFIVHDYAFVTYDPKTHEPQYTIIVPKDTRFPTASDLWKRQLVPTCSLGEPEHYFKLVISEIGEAEPEDRRFAWDESGQVHKLGGHEKQGERVVVHLNEANPTLGYLKPPHPPSDRHPRLEISFGVNAERWLSATVLDLKTQKILMSDEPVVRLL